METQSSPRQTVADLLSKVNEITPAIATCPGLQREEAALFEIRSNLHRLDDGLRRQEESQKKVKEMYRENAVNLRLDLLSVYEQMTAVVAKEPTDDELKRFRLAAETFVEVHDGYLRFQEAANG